ALKLARSARLHPIALCDRQQRPFAFSVPDSLLELLHQLDVARPEPGMDPEVSLQLAASARFEESIASARLAGAATPPAWAKEMLRTGRPPQNKDERMIFNLHRALEEIRDWNHRALSPEMVLQLHRWIMEGVRDEPAAAGRLRRDDEGTPGVGTEGLARPEPSPAGELPARLTMMCAFANGRAPDVFVHPVLRAVILHFWMAYDRPFPDGNGRIARMLFRWAMLRQGYAHFDFTSLSSILLGAPERYARSFLATESDGNDLTYFILHQAEVIRVADRTRRDRLAGRREELQAAGKKLRGFGQLNRRQQALAMHALRNPDARYVITGHQRSHGVTHQTARDDLFDLVRRGLLAVGKEGRIYVFRVPAARSRTAPA
ncbi:MAG: Fic family protein, partial [Opitutaceae bacterium]|nr:Fic family protein [Opitutaceae bacterium]